MFAVEIREMQMENLISLTLKIVFSLIFFDKIILYS